MSVNPMRLSKEDLQKFVTGHCKHHHTYASHPACFEAEQKRPPKIGYFDIECSGLFPYFGVMGCYNIKTKGKDEYVGRMITAKELRSPTMDKELIRDCCTDMLKYDVLVGYYSSKFDIPFVRTQALFHGLDCFPSFGVVKHIDVYYTVKFKLKLQRRSLEAVARMLGIEGKTHVDGALWKKAFMHQDMKLMQDIFDHNKADVEVLEKVHEALDKYTPGRMVSC